MSSTQDDSTVVIANGYARLEERVTAWVEDDPGIRAGRDPWFRGRFFEEWADPGVLVGLRTAFARYDEAEVWVALATTMDMFGEVGPRTAERLGFEYDRAAEAEARTLVAALRPSAGERGTV